MYAGCVLTLSLNDDLGKWVRGAARDSELKNVYLRMTELRYVTALLSGGQPGIKAEPVSWPFMSRHDVITATTGSLS